MEIIRQPGALQTRGRKVCLAIGMFDGVHLGHQQVIRQTILDARQHHAVAVSVTFDRHPNSIVAPERNPPLIYSLPQKLRAIEQVGVDAVLLIEFTPEFSQQPGEQFIRKLAAGFGQIHSICVGSTFVFGHKRSGNVTLLKSLGKELHFTVHGLAAVALDGKIVSSTRIREAVRAGDLDAASQMLGRTYSLAGKVVKGDQLGTKIGFPTANLDVDGLLLPPNGVYAAHASVGGETFAAAVNIGIRPTVAHASTQPRLEAHLLDFDRDVYGQELEITFVEKIRPEQRFASVDELKAQIVRDIHQARMILD